MIFDLLWLDGHSLMDAALRASAARGSSELGLSGDALAASRTRSSGDGAALLAATARAAASRASSPSAWTRATSPGRRSGAWVKVKNSRRQELVIGGWIAGEGGARERIGALLRRRATTTTAQLRYAGRVGTGFDDARARAPRGAARAAARATTRRSRGRAAAEGLALRRAAARRRGRVHASGRDAGTLRAALLQGPARRQARRARWCARSGFPAAGPLARRRTTARWRRRRSASDPRRRGPTCGLARRRPQGARRRRGRGRRPHAEAHQPRQGPVSGGRLHQGAT